MCDDMKTTKDFEEWINALNPEDHEIEPLYQSVKNPELEGLFRIQPVGGNGEVWMVTAPHVDLALILGSQKARNAFLLHLEQTFCRGEDMEGWTGLVQAMSKDN